MELIGVLYVYGGVIMIRKTIVIADRNSHVRTVIQSRFAANGYKFIEAESGQNAIHCATGAKVDVLILGDELPAEQAAVLRNIRNEIDAPIIILSSQSREQFRSVVTQLSEVYYLSKPLDLHRLASLLTSLIGPGTQAAQNSARDVQLEKLVARQNSARPPQFELAH